MDEEKDLIRTAKNLGYFYLKFRPRSEHEMRGYLSKKKKRYKLTEEVIEKVLKELKNEKLIDDEMFIDWHVGRRSRVKQRSQMLLTNELMKYGVQKELIVT